MYIGHNLGKGLYHENMLLCRNYLKFPTMASISNNLFHETIIHQHILESQVLSNCYNAMSCHDVAIVLV